MLNPITEEKRAGPVCMVLEEDPSHGAKVKLAEVKALITGARKQADLVKGLKQRIAGSRQEMKRTYALLGALLLGGKAFIEAAGMSELLPAATAFEEADLYVYADEIVEVLRKLHKAGAWMADSVVKVKQQHLDAVETHRTAVPELEKAVKEVDAAIFKLRGAVNGAIAYVHDHAEPKSHALRRLKRKSPRQKSPAGKKSPADESQAPAGSAEKPIDPPKAAPAQPTA